MHTMRSLCLCSMLWVPLLLSCAPLHSSSNRLSLSGRKKSSSKKKEEPATIALRKCKLLEPALQIRILEFFYGNKYHQLPLFWRACTRRFLYNTVAPEEELFLRNQVTFGLNNAGTVYVYNPNCNTARYKKNYWAVVLKDHPKIVSRIYPHQDKYDNFNLQAPPSTCHQFIGPRLLINQYESKEEKKEKSSSASKKPAQNSAPQKPVVVTSQGGSDPEKYLRTVVCFNCALLEGESWRCPSEPQNTIVASGVVPSDESESIFSMYFVKIAKNRFVLHWYDSTRKRDSQIPLIDPTCTENPARWAKEIQAKETIAITTAQGTHKIERTAYRLSAISGDRTYLALTYYGPTGIPVFDTTTGELVTFITLSTIEHTLRLDCAHITWPQQVLAISRSVTHENKPMYRLLFRYPPAGAIYSFDLKTGKHLSTTKLPDILESVSPHPGGLQQEYVLKERTFGYTSSSTSPGIYCVDIRHKQPRPIAPFSTEQTVLGVASSEDGRHVSWRTVEPLSCKNLHYTPQKPFAHCLYILYCNCEPLYCTNQQKYDYANDCVIEEKKSHLLGVTMPSLPKHAHPSLIKRMLFLHRLCQAAATKRDDQFIVLSKKWGGYRLFHSFPPEVQKSLRNNIPNLRFGKE